MPRRDDTRGDALEVVASANVARIREERGWSQEQLASVCRDVGLPWGKVQIAALETGRKRLMLADAILLAVALAVSLADLIASPRPIAIHEAIADPDVLTALVSRPVSGDELDTPLGRVLRRSSAGFGDRVRQMRDTMVAAGFGDMSFRDAVAVQRASAETPVRELAAALGVEPFVVAAIAHALWGHGLIAERDARAAPDATAKQRGHVTRQLRTEITNAARDRGLLKKRRRR